MALYRSHLPAVKPAGADSAVGANDGVGIHLQEAIAGCKRPLASQQSCLHIPGSSAPQVGMGISGCCGCPMEELMPPHNGHIEGLPKSYVYHAGGLRHP